MSTRAASEDSVTSGLFVLLSWLFVLAVILAVGGAISGFLTSSSFPDLVTAVSALIVVVTLFLAKLIAAPL